MAKGVWAQCAHCQGIIKFSKKKDIWLHSPSRQWRCMANTIAEPNDLGSMAQLWVEPDRDERGRWK